MYGISYRMKMIQTTTDPNKVGKMENKNRWAAVSMEEEPRSIILVSRPALVEL